MLNQICGADLFESIYETLAINLFSSDGAYSGVYSAVRSLYNSIMPIGVMMMFIYFMIALVDKMSSETFTWEQFFRQLAMVLAAKFLMDAKYLVYGLLIGLIATLMIQTEYLRRRDLRPAIENGSAKWNENLKDYQKRYLSTPLLGTGSLNMIFAQQLYLSMDTRKTLRNNNVMVIGGSGTGKSRFFVMPNLLQANCSFVVTDPSGELLETMGAFLEAEGYEIRVFNLVQMEHSDAYNPFSYINKQEDVLIMVDALIKNTTPSGSRSSDPFWEKAETALLTAICFYVLTQGKAIHNFASVMYFLRQAAAEEGETSTLDKVFEAFAKTNPDHIAVTSYAVYKSAGGGKTAQSILISCQTRLQMFNLDAVQALTSTDTLDLGSIGDKKVALFCITPTGNTTFNFLVSMMYTQLFEVLYHHAETKCPGKRLKYPVRFMLDEFANIGTIPNFSQKLATAFPRMQSVRRLYEQEENRSGNRFGARPVKRRGGHTC